MTSKMGRLILLLSLLVLSLAAVCPTVLAADIDEPEPILCELTGIDGDDDDHEFVGRPADQKQPTSNSSMSAAPDDGSLLRTLILLWCQGGYYRIV